MKPAKCLYPFRSGM